MNTKKSETVKKLNKVLADLQVVYQNQRTMHWLVKGPDFYMLHNMYEGFYNETAEVVDEVAERILMLGSVPYHQFSDYVSNSTIEQVVEVPKGRESLNIAVANYENLLQQYRDIVEHASSQNDEGTVSLFSELIAKTEKTLWMLNATLS